jgi:hypothetical protein
MQPVFYDFEASGLAGFPIEVGWACLDGDNVKSDSLLIAPAAGWDVVGDWKEGIESIHGISLRQLQSEGLPTVSVASQLNFCLAGRILYSDSPLDTRWMAQLFSAAQLEPSFKVALMPAAELVDDLRRKLALSLKDAMEIAEYVGKRFPHTHRARLDAVYWAELTSAFIEAAGGGPQREVADPTIGRIPHLVRNNNKPSCSPEPNLHLKQAENA